MGNIAYNQGNRMDTLMYLLCYPQRQVQGTIMHVKVVSGLVVMDAGVRW